jgi:cell division protein FtsB
MRWAVKIALAVLVIGGAMYLFIFPTRTYLAQKQDIAVQERTIAALKAEDAKLAGESRALQGAPTIEQIARKEYGLVKPGQQAFTVVPATTKAVPTAPPPVRHSAWYSQLEFWHHL